ncbi:unnamed protein product [Chrysodeixis includens]|uniref:Uncharacterized protein n=1 Tax=Chrysodeixis includens TaxID=689277 RepID=A0A9P0BW72_CHRIL|nr:unnamed protein product [Chrysodeixis includens]
MFIMFLGKCVKLFYRRELLGNNYCRSNLIKQRDMNSVMFLISGKQLFSLLITYCVLSVEYSAVGHFIINYTKSYKKNMPIEWRLKWSIISPVGIRIKIGLPYCFLLVGS